MYSTYTQIRLQEYKKYFCFCRKSAHKAAFKKKKLKRYKNKHIYKTYPDIVTNKSLSVCTVWTDTYKQR